MPVEVIVAIIGAVATVAASIIAARATIDKRRAEARVKAIDSAPLVFARHLGTVINRLPPPITNPGDERNVIINARAIVQLRDSLREPLRGVEAALNSEISALGEVLAGVEAGRRADATTVRAVADKIQVLRIVWPSKRDEITLRIKQVLTTLETLAEPEPLPAAVAEQTRPTARPSEPPDDRPRPEPPSPRLGMA